MATEVVKTIRASGGDYTSVSAWEASLPASLVTADEQHTGVVYDDWASGLSDTFTFSGPVTDATRYIHLKAASGAENNGVPESGVFITGNSGSNAVTPFNCSLDYTRVSNLEFRNERSTLAGITAVFSPGQYGLVDGCIFSSVGGGGCGANGGGSNTDSSTWPIFQNCLSIGHSSGWYNAVTSRTKYKLYNCLAANNGIGFASGSTNKAIIHNSVAYGNVTGFSTNQDASSSHNASSDTTAPGTGSITSITSAEFVDAANGDFHLASGSQLIGAGTNLYASFDHDIDGDIRPSSGAWDIGFDHYVASGGGTTISITDTGIGADAMAGISVALGLSDAGVGVDSAPGAAAGVYLTDAGVGNDALTLAALVALADTGAGTDSLTLAVALQINDSGAGADLVNLLTGQIISLADAGVGADVISAITVSLGLADASTGLDATVIQAALQLTDAGSGIDALSVLTATLIQILDAGTGTDGLSIAVAVPMSDAGMGADLLAIQAMVSLVESGTGAEAVLRFDSAQRIYTITFTLAKRRAEFSLRTRQAVFTLN